MPATRPSSPPVALCLGGMDPSGGAGLLRDGLTLAELGCQPMAVSLAETLQNGLGCSRIEPPALDASLRLENLAPHLVGRWGVKIGLCALGRDEFRRLCATLDQLAPSCRIWDPILAPSAGVGLHEGADLRAMASDLLAMGNWVVSPNRGEAARFAGLAPEAIPGASLEALTTPWLAAGAAAVWLKGGHGTGAEVQDVWVTPDQVLPLEAVPRLPGERRGTGCILAASWLGLRLRGMSAVEAARLAAQRLRDRWELAFAPGEAGRMMFGPSSGHGEAP